MSQFSKLTLRLVGAIMLGFGISAAIFAAWIIERAFTLHRPVVVSAVVVISLLIILSVFFGLVGYRLFFNRPTARGSTLSPIAWKVLAGFFWLSGLGLAVASFAPAQFGALFAIVCLGALGYGCLLAARGTSTKSLPSTVFPPETSLIGIEGFAPAGFVCGVEILNDDRTSMAFVVSMLVDKMGMKEKRAIEIMLDIHEKGGVLLATSTPEEASRIADSITEEARARNHPLVCRAVNAAQR